jgi:MFS family permease
MPALSPRASSPRTPSGRWVAASVFCLSSTLNYLDRLLLASVAPLLMAEFHLTNEAYGWLGSALSLTYALSSPLTGALLDRLGLNKGASLAVGVWSVCCAATSLVTGFADWLRPASDWAWQSPRVSPPWEK